MIAFSQKFEKPTCPESPQVQPRTFNPAIRVALRLGKFMVPKSILREAAHQNRLRNAQAPIHRLPPELLAEIMVYTIDWMYWGTWQLRILSMVSTYWRDIILSSPRCWSVLDGLHEPEEWKAVLAHNPAGTIDLRGSTENGHSHTLGDKTANSIIDFALSIIEAAPCMVLTVDPNSSYIRISSEPMPGIPATWVLWSKDIPGFDAQLMNVDVQALSMRIAAAANPSSQFIVMPLVPSEEHVFEDLLSNLGLVSREFEPPSGPAPPQTQPPRSFDTAAGVALRLRGLMVSKSRLRQTAHKNRLRNAQAPIHRLPPELLVEIIVYAIDWMYWSVRQLQTFAMVSTHWRDIILSSPRCWSVLSGLQKPQRWKAVLAHNPAGVIDVRCAGERIEEFIPLAVAAAPRTGTLTLWVDDQNELVEKIFGVPLPILRDLLVYNAATDQKVIPSLGEGVFLRHVELYRTGMRWDEPRLANLSTLCLVALLDGAPTATQLYTLLSCSPNLERLQIANWSNSADASYQLSIEDSASNQEQLSHPTFPPIQLNQLSALIATWLPPEVLAFLFAIIRASSCQTLVVIHDGDDKTANSILDFALPIIEAAPSIALKLDPNSSYMRISSEPMPGIPATWVLWSKDIPGLDAQLMKVDVKTLSIRIAGAVNSSSQFTAMPLVISEQHSVEDLLSDLEAVRCAKQSASY
ncbi:hypothetical protein FRC00_001637 [Tulasnella sp. 408]|nr:hypothetical protein FRC00_001637 [Tulasnella sp. 408]